MNLLPGILYYYAGAVLSALCHTRIVQKRRGDDNIPAAFFVAMATTALLVRCKVRWAGFFVVTIPMRPGILAVLRRSEDQTAQTRRYVMTMISISDLTFAYEGSSDNVFEHVSFHMDTEWRLGFTGRNGRGKTTFLRLLLESGKAPGKRALEYTGTISSPVEF